MTALIQADIRRFPLPDKSVNLIATSPPYYGQRRYAGGEAQLGSEPTPEEYLVNLFAFMQECWRVLTDDGLAFINLGDKRAGSVAPGTTSGLGGTAQGGRTQLEGAYTKAHFGRRKSRQMLPWRFALGCIDGEGDPDGIGWIVSEYVWCLSGGARVYARTSTGDRPIMLRSLVRSYRPEDVQLWNGEKWTQVLGWNKTPDDEGALELELRTGERIGCTPGHRWPAERGVIRADEVRVGDIIETTALPEPSAPVSPAFLPDDDIGWLIGLYIAEGSRSGRMVQFAGHVKEEARHGRLARIAAALDGQSAVYQTSENGVTCNLSGTAILGVIDRYVSAGTAHTKRLTFHAWQRSNEFLAAVVRGYLEGDGHFDAKSGRWRLGFCANDEWAADLRTLSARLGARLSLRRATHHGYGKDFPGWKGEWRWVRSAHPNAKKDGEVVAIRRSRAREFYDLGVADEPHLFALASGVLTHNSKPNGMPESVGDRCRDSHEYIFQMAKSERWFTGIDEIRESYAPGAIDKGERSSYAAGSASGSLAADGTHHVKGDAGLPLNELGKLPASVWTIPTESLRIPEAVLKHYELPEHFAAFPQEIPRRIILGWSPSAVCCTCGEGRRPVTSKRLEVHRETNGHKQHKGGELGHDGGWQGDDYPTGSTVATIEGYACACTPRTSHRGKRGDWTEGREVMPEHGSDDMHSPGPAVPRRPGGFGTKVPPPERPMIEYHLDGWTPPPSRPARVLDPFLGTGTTVGVARALGRVGIGLDLSFDYLRLARWRIEESGHFSKTAQRTHKENQGSLL